MSRDTSVVLELKAKVEALTKELADAKLQLGNALTANAVLEQRLAAESEDDLNFAAETGVVIGDLKKQLELTKKLADGFSAALAKAEAENEKLSTMISTFSSEPLADFDTAWAKMESLGYQYDGGAPEQVRLGWFMAQETLAEWRKVHV